MKLSRQEQLEKFILALFEPTDVLEVRSLFPERSTAHYAGSIDEIVGRCQRSNDAGANIYIGGNPRKGFGPLSRGNKNVLLARSVWVEFDEKQLGISCDHPIEQIAEARRRLNDNYIDPPSMTVYSGHGIWFYWLLSTPQRDIQAWAEAMAMLAFKLDSDPSVTNPERICRGPGTTNHKPPVREAELIEYETDCRYLWCDIVAPLYHSNMPELPPEPENTPELVEKHVAARRNVASGQSVIDSFNTSFSLRELLAKHGYHVVGNRFRRPGKEDRGFSGSIIQCADGRERSFHFSNNDHLYSTKFKFDTNSYLGICDAFDVFLQIEHRGDLTRAVKAAATQLGIPLPKQKRDAQVMDEILASAKAADLSEAFLQLPSDAANARLRLAGIVRDFTSNPMQVRRLVDQIASLATEAA